MVILVASCLADVFLKRSARMRTDSDRNLSAVGTSAIRILLRKIRLTLSSKHGVFATSEADPNPARKTRERVLTIKASLDASLL